MEPGNGEFLLQWKDFQANASSTFQEMRKDIDFADVTLACVDNYAIEAHKMVLAASSSFFCDFLRQNKHPKPFIYLRGIKDKALTSILNFMYNGEVNMPHEDLDDFMKIGDDLKVKGLEREDLQVQAYLGDALVKNQRKYKDMKKHIVKKKIIKKEQEPFKYQSAGSSRSNLVLVDTFNEELSNIGLPSNQENKCLQQEEIFKHLNNVIEQKISKLSGVLACKECDFQSKHITNVKNHIESNHLTRDTKIPCLYCDVFSHTRAALRHHLKQYHTGI